MTYRELEAEARRVLEGARSYQKGILLSAIFRDNITQIEIFYYTPQDIPLKVPYLGSQLYLYSVCPAERRRYPKPETPQTRLKR